MRLLRHPVDVVRQIFPGAGHAGNLGLAAELAVGADLAGHAGHFRRERPQLIDHRVDGFLELQNFAAHVGGDLLGQVAAGDGGGHFGDVAHLGGQVAGHGIDVVGQVFPGAGHAGDDGLAAELAVGADLAGHARDFGGEGAQLIDHRVDGLLELQDLAAHVDGDLLRKIAVGHGDGDVGDIAHLGGQVAGHQVDALGEVFPNAADVLHLGLAAELAFGADFAGHARHLGGEDAELADHGVDDARRAQELALERLAVAFEVHGLGQVALGDGVDGARHFGRRPNEIADEGIDRFFHALPGAARGAEDGPLADLPLLAHHAADALELPGHPLVGLNDFVDGVRDLAFQARPIRRQAHGECSFLDGGQAPQACVARNGSARPSGISPCRCDRCLCRWSRRLLSRP